MVISRSIVLTSTFYLILLNLVFFYFQNTLVTIRTHIGSVTGVYTYYSYLNGMFTRTLTPKDCDSINLAFYTKNLLA
jgi:hypothetical protein